MKKEICINNHIISDEQPTYIIAEMSGNHNQSIEKAKRIIDAAADAGADAIKLQTYTADTITINCDSELFQSPKGLWEGTTLYELYQQAYTPWEWHRELMEYANSKGLDLFSSPFDLTAIDFLEQLGVPAYKVASPEINDIPFLRKIAKTGKPIIISTGMAYVEDIDLALRTCAEEGNDQVILLKCVSAYPTPLEEVNLNAIPLMRSTFECISGLSDHTMGTEVAVASVALGAKVIEKHLITSREDKGTDAAFSMEPDEFKSMVEQIRNIEKALGKSTLALTDNQVESRKWMRSLFAVEDIPKGHLFTPDNVRSIRPGAGLHTKHYEDIIGKTANREIKKGTPINWDLIG